jgi:hypothetical protein
MADTQTGSTFIVRIKRQQRPDEAVRWEEYELRYRPHMNVIQCLRDIAEKPYTREGKESTRKLRRELPRRSLRRLRHAHQRRTAPGLLRARG